VLAEQFLENKIKKLGENPAPIVKWDVVHSANAQKKSQKNSEKNL
jgi:hypothetical protein